MGRFEDSRRGAARAAKSLLKIVAVAGALESHVIARACLNLNVWREKWLMTNVVWLDSKVPLHSGFSA